MRLVQDTRACTETFRNTVLTVGSFDGIHLGHQTILNAVVQRAGAIDGTPAVLTLDPHPRQFFAPEHAPPILTTLEKKCQLLDEAGIAVLFVLRFDASIAEMEPIRFVEEVLVRRCQAKAMVVGHDFRFGRGAKGDYELLLRLGGELGFEVSQAPALLIDGERVSSSSIRESLLLGDLESVEKFLGRRYSIVGEVERGRGIGAELGYPTANIRPHHNATPAQGVYIGEAVVSGEKHPAAINIGFAPTIPHDQMTIEAFLIDFDREVRGQEIELFFIRRLRDEMKFASRDALISQIGEDVEAVKRHFALR